MQHTPPSFTPYIVLAAFALLVIAGFYLVFDRMSSLKDEVNDLKLQLTVAKLSGTPQVQPPASSEPAAPEPSSSQPSTPTAPIS